jgi:hypothetical protein
MKGWVRALLLAMSAIAAVTACGKGGSGGAGGGVDAGLTGPTKLTATWTFSGKPASAAECSTRGAATVFVTLSATLDPTLHKTLSADCATGKVELGTMNIEDLGQPYVEGALLDDKGVALTNAGALVTPTAKTTGVNLDFYPTVSTSSSSSSSSSSTSSSSSSSGTTTGTGGAGGATTTTTTTTTSAAGGADAG